MAYYKVLFVTVNFCFIYFEAMLFDAYMFIGVKSFWKIFPFIIR